MKTFKYIQRILKNLFDKSINNQLQKGFLQALPFWLASLLVGLIAISYTKLFTYAERTTSSIFHHTAWLIFLITPACFITAWWLVVKFSPYAKGSGIPQVIAAIELSTPGRHQKVNRLLGLKIIFVKIASSLVMVLGGGLIGREGPTIQIAASVFQKINKSLPAWWPKISKRNMIMTGAAAGLAAAFNTPLGGIVFAIEELTKTHISYFKTALFSAVIIAGLTAQAILGPYLYLGYPNISNLDSYIFFVVILVAILAGLLGSLMSKAILQVMKWKSRFRFNYLNLLYVACAGLVVATIAYFINERVLGSGKELMTHALFTSDKYVSGDLPFLRIGGTLLSFTSGASGGIFAPSLSAGASVGSMMAGWFHLSETNSNLLILGGMVGFLTGVTRTPFTSAILVLEMTDRHNVILHLMVAAMVSNLVSFLIDRHSLYDHLKFQYLQDIRHEDPPVPETPKRVISD